jgi:hypothetical protein
VKTASLTKQFVRDCRSGRSREWRAVEKQKGQKQAPTQQLDTFIHTNTHLIPWAGCTATSCRRGSSLTSIAYCKYERGPCFTILGTYKYVQTFLKRHRRVLHMPRRMLHMRTAGNHGKHWLYPRCHVSFCVKLHFHSCFGKKKIFSKPANSLVLVCKYPTQCMGGA